MSRRRVLCYLCLVLALVPILLILGLYVLFTLDLLDALFPDELDDDYPGNPKLFASIPVLNPFLYRDTLGGDGSIRRGGYKWIYVHGNSSCYSEDPGSCDDYDAAFAQISHAYAHENPSLHRKLTTLDCDAYPPLCNDYFVRPPALVHVSSAGPCEFLRSEVEGWDFHCPVENRVILLPLFDEPVALNGNFPYASHQLSRFLEGECMWEMSKTKEEMIGEMFAGPDEENGWLGWVAWQFGTGVGYGILGVANGWNWITGG